MHRRLPKVGNEEGHRGDLVRERVTLSHAQQDAEGHVRTHSGKNTQLARTGKRATKESRSRLQAASRNGRAPRIRHVSAPTLQRARVHHSGAHLGAKGGRECEAALKERRERDTPLAWGAGA